MFNPTKTLTEVCLHARHTVLLDRPRGFSPFMTLVMIGCQSLAASKVALLVSGKQQGYKRRRCADVTGDCYLQVPWLAVCLDNLGQHVKANACCCGGKDVKSPATSTAELN